MTTLKQVVALTFLLASAAFAVVPTRSNSNYGQTPDALQNPAGNPKINGIGILEQMFCDARNDPPQCAAGTYFFDYLIQDSVTNFDLSLQGSSIVLSGIFVCDPNPNNAKDVNCVDPNGAFAGDFTSPGVFSGGDMTPGLSGVTFHINGQGQGLVFFAEIDSKVGVPTPCINGVCALPANTPEPGSLILLASVLLVLVGFGRRRLRASPQ